MTAMKDMHRATTYEADCFLGSQANFLVSCLRGCQSR